MKSVAHRTIFVEETSWNIHVKFEDVDLGNVVNGGAEHESQVDDGWFIVITLSCCFGG